MIIEPFVGVGPWKFGMKIEEIEKNIQGEYSIENFGRAIVSENEEFYFDRTVSLCAILLSRQSPAKFQGVGIGSSLGDAQRVYNSPAYFASENFLTGTTELHGITFRADDGIAFSLSEKEMEMLYESGALEDEELFDDFYKLDEMIIQEIYVIGNAIE